MNFRNTTLWSWIAAGLLATTAMTMTMEAEAQQPRRSHHGRRNQPAAEAVEPAPPPAPNPLPRSGPSCQALAGGLPDGLDPRPVIARALDEARSHADDLCLALVASRQVSLGECAIAANTIQEAAARSPSASFVRCVGALVQACNLSANPPAEGQLPICGQEIDSVIATLSTACVSVAYSDTTAPGSIINALQSLSRVCRDDGTVAGEIAGVVANHWSGTGTGQLNSSLEYSILRDENPPGGLSDATLLTRTRTWLAGQAPFQPGVTQNTRLALIDYLDRQAASTTDGRLRMTVWNRAAAMGILSATIRSIEDSSGAFGQALDDLLYLERRGLLFDEQVLVTATHIPIQQGFRARLSQTDATRVEQAYDMLSRSRAGSAALLRLRIGGALWAYQRSPNETGSVNCVQVARHETNIDNFVRSEIGTVPIAAYRGDLRAILTEMDRANRACEIPNPARERRIEGWRTSIESGGGIVGGTTVNYNDVNGGAQ